ncbi:hypothetical protein V1477_013704 [Vespula maculifrons]|uniref:Uncharacterized protein n=1 Tax=Vespula maculifrons TaxID=7453 RepID=A0ABD2BP28_VESMC
MVLKEEEEAATKKKLIGIRMKRSGGDGLPLVKRYKAADFGNGPVLSRISTSPHLNTRSTHASHDRSCLEMSEADGVDSGAICKRGFIHLQFAEKPEAPEAERHLGSRILE